MALSKVVLEICEEMEVEVDRVPELMLGDSDSLRDLVVGAVPTGAASPSFSLSRSRWRVFSTWTNDRGRELGAHFHHKRNFLKGKKVFFCQWLDSDIVGRQKKALAGS